MVRETHDWQEEVAALACEGPHRPLCLLPCPEPIEVIAEVPEGAPQRFRWRKVAYAVARAEGPERIGAEWWRPEDAGRPQRTRDYFRLEDGDGRRFWVYRDGLYGRETDAPRWYMHGVFA
jgi:protein ImuB